MCVCSHWLVLRDEKVVAKGKGELVTYWLEVKTDSSADKSSRRSETGSERFCANDDLGLIEQNKTVETLLSEKTNRLIDWNTDVLRQLLQQVIASRDLSMSLPKKNGDGISEEFLVLPVKNPFDEVKEIIPLPQVKNQHQ